MSVSSQIQKKAYLLAKADLEGMDAVAKESGVHERTLYRWRAELGWNDELRESYQKIVEKRTDLLVAEQHEQLETGISVALSKWINFMQQCADELDPADPDAAGIAVKGSEVLLEMLIVMKQVKHRSQQSAGSDRQLKSAQA